MSTTRTPENDCTALTVQDAVAIVSKFDEEQQRVSVCDVCKNRLEGNTYTCCKPHESETGIHKGHTCCETCKETEFYISENRCRACLEGSNGRRSSKQKAGYPLHPPQLNQFGTQMLELVRGTENGIRQAKEEADATRRQENASRRAVEVQRVREKREEHRKLDEQVREAEHLGIAEDLAGRAEEVEKKEATLAAREARLKEAEERVSEKEKHVVTLADEAVAAASAAPLVPANEKKRKRCTDPVVIEERKAKRLEKRMQKKTHHDELVEKARLYDDAQRKLDTFVSIATNIVVDMGFDDVTFESTLREKIGPMTMPPHMPAEITEEEGDESEPLQAVPLVTEPLD